jgi:hypothetical protein
MSDAPIAKRVLLRSSIVAKVAKVAQTADMSGKSLERRTLTMTEPQLTKPSPRRKPAREAAAPMHAYEVKGGYSAALPKVRLPEGAAVAIIPSSPAVAEELERSPNLARTSWVVNGDHMVVQRDRSLVFVSTKIGKSAFEPDARARALLRGVESAQADLRDAGGAFEMEEVRALLNDVSRQAIDKKIKDGSLLAIPGPSNRRRFPTAQFNDDGSVVEGLRAVQKALGYSSPWSVLNFLVNPLDDLGGDKPIDRLRGGDTAIVVEAARRAGVHAA